ncbi:MAG: C-GCAxxG-C-C family protein [bacterium]|nr:C-GCAxxG-C-C family protein [bacterium]
MKNSDKAVLCFQKGFNCAQAVLSAFSDEFGLDEKTSLKISCAFGGGMGRMQETCGAVTAAFMVIGLKYGKYKIEDKDAKELTYKLVRDFAGEFKKLHKSINCRELLGCDVTTKEGLELANEKNAFANCDKFVKDASEILEKMLSKKGEL